MGFELPWQQAGNTGQTHWGRFVGGAGSVVSYHPAVGIPRAVAGKGGPYEGVGKSLQGFGHAVNLPAKVNQAAGQAGDALRKAGEGWGAGFAGVGRGLGAGLGGAFEGAFAGIGSGAGQAISGIGQGAGAGFGGGVQAAASGLGEGIMSLALPALIVVGALFLYKKVK